MIPNLNINIAKDEYGKDLFIDLVSIKHLLIAGNTGSGKSTLLHNIIGTLLLNNEPEAVKFIIFDSNKVELSMYDKSPHLLTPVVTDPKKIVLALRWAGKEVDRRLDLLKRNNFRDISEYDDSEEMMSHIVIIIDDLSDVAQVYSKEAESATVKIAQSGHIVGLHLVLSTSRLTSKVFTKSMGDLIRARIATQTSSVQDSKLIIGTKDACDLIGVGNMLFRDGMKYIIRGRSLRVSIKEIKKVIKAQIDKYKEEILSTINLEGANTYTSYNSDILNDDIDKDEDNILYEEAKSMILESGKASTSYIQRKLRIGYSRSARLIDLLEQRGIIGPSDGSEPREIYKDEDKKYSHEEDDLYYKAKEIVLKSGMASVSLLHEKLNIGYSKAVLLIDLLAKNKIISQAYGDRAREVYGDK